MVRRSAYALAVVAAMCMPLPAAAQAFRSGTTFSLGGTTAPVINPDVTYNSKDHQYLQVAGKSFIEGHVVDATGALLRTFTVTDNANYSQMPRAAYSPDAFSGAGGYLVTWHETMGPFARVRGRLFRADGGNSTASFDISVISTTAGTSSSWIMGAPAAYSTGSHEFLVAWQNNFNVTNDIYFARVNNSGTLLASGGIMNTLLSAGTPDWERDPSVAYNPDADEFYVAYAGYLDAGRYGYVAGRRIKAGTGAILSTATPLVASSATYLSSVTYNTSGKQYLVGWDNFSPAGQQIYGVVLDQAGNPVGPAHVISPYYAAYDALDLDYNIPSGQYLLTTHGKNWEDAAVTVLANGNGYDNGFVATQTTGLNGNFNPMIAASTTEKKWLLVTASNFAYTSAQFIATAASETGGGTGGGGGGGGGTPPPTPACSAGLSTSTINVGGSGGPVGVAVSGNCTWSVTPGAAWVTVSSGGSGTGAGLVILSIARNPAGSQRAATVAIGALSVTVTQAGSVVASVSHDLNGDGVSDIIWHNVATGELGTWYLNGSAVVGTYAFTIGRVTDLAWKVVGSGDLDGDGLADLIWQHDQGYLAMWRMQGPQVLATEALSISQVTDPNWKVDAAGDVDGDGKADLIWRNQADGRLAVWYMSGKTVRATFSLSVPARPDLNWKIVGAGDINRDGKADILWQNTATGALDIWALNGYQVIGQSGPLPGSADLNWRVGGVGDVNGDGSADLIWQHNATGDLGVWFLNGTSVIGQFGLTMNGSAVRVSDLHWKVVGPG